MSNKLLIQIPCFNEEASLPITLNAIPKKIKNIDSYDILVIDDGSTDKTLEIAKKFDVKYIISNKKNLGLAKTFENGVNFFKSQDYDYLVNLDADNQYSANDIEKLVEPLVSNEFDTIIGQRKINSFKIFGFFKSLLQLFGSFIISILVGHDIKDATSGFRAYNKKILNNFKIYNEFSYTLESLLFFKSQKAKIKCIDIETNKTVLRKSRLFKSNFDYIMKQLPVIIRSFSIYFPFRFFSYISALFFIPGAFLILRFFIYYVINSFQGGNIQSLILATILIIISFLLLMLGVISESISRNRKLIEKINDNLNKEDTSAQNKYTIIKE